LPQSVSIYMAPTGGTARANRPAHRLPRAHRAGIYNMLTVTK
jgi:hypothetical protein